MPNSAARWPYLRGPATAADKYEEAPHDASRLTGLGGPRPDIAEPFHDVGRDLAAARDRRRLDPARSLGLRAWRALRQAPRKAEAVGMNVEDSASLRSTLETL